MDYVIGKKNKSHRRQRKSHRKAITEKNIHTYDNHEGLNI